MWAQLACFSHKHQVTWNIANAFLSLLLLQCGRKCATKAEHQRPCETDIGLWLILHTSKHETWKLTRQHLNARNLTYLYCICILKLSFCSPKDTRNYQKLLEYTPIKIIHAFPPVILWKQRETMRNNEKQRQGSAFEEVLNQGTKALRRPLRSGSSLGGSAPLAGAK